jgi:hypothetical protein
MKEEMDFGGSGIEEGEEEEKNSLSCTYLNST